MKGCIPYAVATAVVLALLAMPGLLMALAAWITN